MATTPKTRREFWQRKFDENVRRDTVAVERLKELGWDVLVVWECETRNLSTLERKLDAFLGGSGDRQMLQGGKHSPGASTDM